MLIAHILLTHHDHQEPGLMKIYDIPLKRLIINQTEANSKEEARQEGQSGVEKTTRHITLHKDHSHSIYCACGNVLHKDGAEPRGISKLRLQ